MEFKVLKLTEIDVKYLDVFIGNRVYPEDIQFGDEDFVDWNDVFEKYPLLKGNCGKGYSELYLRINVETGKVENWPKDIYGGFRTIKVVDEGTYILRDNELNELTTYNGYVPDCLAIEDDGWGDYFEFNINNGIIDNWKFSQKDVNELFEIDDEN